MNTQINWITDVRSLVVPKLSKLKSVVEYVGMARILVLPWKLVHEPYSLEMPQQCASDKYPQCVFMEK